MSTTETRDGLEELARRGTDLFERRVRPQLGPGDDGKFVAIDITSGDHELDDDDYSAVIRLRARHPTAEVWLARVGQPTAYKLRRGR